MAPTTRTQPSQAMSTPTPAISRYVRRLLEEHLPQTQATTMRFHLDGHLHQVHSDVAGLFGYTLEEIRGKTLDALFEPPVEGMNLGEMFQEICQATRPIQFHSTARHAKGHNFSVYVHLTCDGEWVLCYVMDYTMLRIALEQAMLESGSKFGDTAGGGMEAAARMVHEMRTPLNAVLGFVRLVEEGQYASEPEMREYLANARRAAYTLLDLTGNVEDFAALGSGRLSLVRTEFELPGLLDEVLRIQSPDALLKHIELGARIAPDVPRLLLGDRLRLQQVLSNLTGNGIRHTSGGSVRISVERCGPPEDSGAPELGEWLRLTVENSGGRIDPAFHQAMFDGLVGDIMPSLGQNSGTGLGLKIASRLVEEMRGTIKLESRGEGGLALHVLLPLQSPEFQQEMQEGYPEALLGARLIYLSPDSDWGTWQAGTLAESGLRAEPAQTTEQARDIMTRGWEENNPVHFVLVENSTARAEAVEFAQWVRQNAPQYQPHILLLAGMGQQKGHEGLAQHGFSGCLIKPLHMESLLLMLEQALNAHGIRGAESGPEFLTIEASAGAVPESRRFRILVAEDNPVNQKLVQTLLEGRGYQTALASNGQEALDMLDAQAFDLVLMDVQMPVMDGLRATRAMRARPHLESLPVLALSADATDDDRHRCMDAGMNEHLSKPVIPESLFRALRYWLHRQEGTVGASYLLDTRFMDTVRDQAMPHRRDKFLKWLKGYLGGSAELMAEAETALAREERQSMGLHLRKLRNMSAGVGAAKLSRLLGEMDGSPGAEGHTTWREIRQAHAEVCQTIRTRYLEPAELEEPSA